MAPAVPVAVQYHTTASVTNGVAANPSQGVYPTMVPPLTGDATGPYSPATAYPVSAYPGTLAAPLLTSKEPMTGRYTFSTGVRSDAGIMGSIIVDESNFDSQRWFANQDDIRSGRAWRGDAQRFRPEPGGHASTDSASPAAGTVIKNNEGLTASAPTSVCFSQFETPEWSISNAEQLDGVSPSYGRPMQDDSQAIAAAVSAARLNKYYGEGDSHRLARQHALLESLNTVEKSRVAVNDNESICYDIWAGLGSVGARSVVELSSRNVVEKSNAAVNGNGPITYPPAEVWGELGKQNAGYRILLQPSGSGNAEHYASIVENRFAAPFAAPLSTFAVDVDTASYANVRRFLDNGQLPPPDAVRVEEMVNYFAYDYPEPKGDEPFSVHVDLADCPWKAGHRLLRIGLKGREIKRQRRGPSNLVFLLDSSGSMADENKLPLVKQAMRLLVDELGEGDRVAIVTYATEPAVRLESTGGENKKKILEAVDSLVASGWTNGSGGIELAYEQAAKHFQREGDNRILLATDGDLNRGVTGDAELAEFIKKKARSGVFLTVLGFGQGNLKDSKLERLADCGNGVYAYVDSLREARKVLVEQLTGSVYTIAKDVKVQIEFNPARVAAYRLLGYENRRLAARDFNDDRKDAGEIGAGHTVTALYELVPAKHEDDEAEVASAPALKYQKIVRPANTLTDAARGDELATLRLRYKDPQGKKSRLVERVVGSRGTSFSSASPDFQFAAAVASFAMLLRGSHYTGGATLAAVEEYATPGLGNDPKGHRAGFVDLVRKARTLKGAQAAAAKRSWGPEQATGAPDTHHGGDSATAWASLGADSGTEWLQLEYDREVAVAEVRIRETDNPGAVSRVVAVVDGEEKVLWEGEDPTTTVPAEFVVRPEEDAKDVTSRTIRIYLDTSRKPGWNEIDAVELVGKDGSRQWASRATASSSYADR